jgi:thiamine-phosphate pyrophosphorylase
MKAEIDYSLYLVTDRPLCLGKPLEDVIAEAVSGGVTIVQVREKLSQTREFINLAQTVQRILKPRNIPLIINDRIDVALAVKADGVHIGQSDMPYDIARRLMGLEAIIGLSVETMEQAEEAEHLDVDYLGVSPIFSTPTKTDTYSEWGLDGLARLKRQSRHKLVAIGGLNASNAGQAIRAGADGIAVVSAICSAGDPKRSAHELLKIIKKAKGEDSK